MQSYIVRIYRRGRNSLLGMVESCDDRSRRAFTDYDELWEILNSSEGEYLTCRRSRTRAGKAGRGGTGLASRGT